MHYCIISQRTSLLPGHVIEVPVPNQEEK